MPPSEAVEVWVADLDGVPDELFTSLSERERERAALIRDERGRRRWSASRAVLRDLLSRSTHTDPADLEIELDADGKPRLRRAVEQRIGSAHQRMRFNLSHSGPLALYAICPDSEVGVDVELAHRRGANGGRELAIARRMLGEQVASRLQALAPHERHDEFLRAWVVHEAAVKCVGVGLSAARQAAALAVIWVTPIELAPPRLAPPCPRAFGALAVQGGPIAVRRQVWEPLPSGQPA